MKIRVDSLYKFSTAYFDEVQKEYTWGIADPPPVIEQHLFVIGLEMQPTRLWTLRRQIFGLGLAQVVVCGALLTALGMGAGLKPVVAFIAAMGFVLSSTVKIELSLRALPNMPCPVFIAAAPRFTGSIL